jgi:uncharacterized membrane protein YdjX (TVP38/TMEM64 family)
MQRALRPLILLSIVLAVPIVPLVLWGEMFTDQIAAWQQAPPSRWVLAVGVTAILASDIFLPVPSGPVSTLAGAGLGAVVGTAACWLGMTAGACVAFALARAWGRRVALRFASADDLDRMRDACRRHDVWMLLVTRPLPVLAEACVLLVGTLDTPWQRFLPAVALSNLAIAAVYCLFGQFAAEHEWLIMAVCLSLAVPVALAVWVRQSLASRKR